MNGSLPPSLRARILEAAAARPSPARRAFRRRRALAIFVAMLLPMAFVLFRPLSLRGRPLAYAAVVAGTSLVIAVGAGLGALLRGRSTLGRPRDARQLLAIVVPCALALGAVAANLFSPTTLRLPAADMGVHLQCAMTILTLGVLVFAALAFPERGSDPVAPRVTGRSLGAVAGAWSAFALSIHCAEVDPAHVLGAHVVPVALLVLLGSFAGARWLAMRGIGS